MPCPSAPNRYIPHARITTRFVVVIVAVLIFVIVAIVITMIMLNLEQRRTVVSDTQVTLDEKVDKKRHYMAHYNIRVPEERIYLISVGDDYGPVEHRDREGNIVGFNMDLVNLVCEEAGISCVPVYSNYAACWGASDDPEDDGLSHAGIGITSRWWDACIGWFVTVDRIKVFAFSEPYLLREPAFFFHRSDIKFDAFNILRKKIGFIRGWAMDPSCLARKRDITGSILPKENIFRYDTNKDAMVAVENGTIDAVFAAWGGARRHLTSRISYTKHPMNCLLAGSTIMTRKDSELPALWNVGFHKARFRQSFLSLCQKNKIKYSHLGEIRCIDDEDS